MGTVDKNDEYIKNSQVKKVNDVNHDFRVNCPFLKK